MTSRLLTLTENEASLIVAPLIRIGFTARQFSVWLDSQAFGARSMKLLHGVFNCDVRN